VGLRGWACGSGQVQWCLVAPVAGHRGGAGGWPGGDGLDPYYPVPFGGLVCGGGRSLMLRCHGGLPLGGGEACFDFLFARFWWTLGVYIRLGRNP
jgi:hypothetical protein